MSVGSPALAAYSLVITARNTRMVKKRAISSKHEARQDVVKVLIALQQQPHKLTEDPLLLPSIPNHDKWRNEILERLDKKNGWSLAIASIVVWVVIAFAFTLVGSFVSLGGPDGGGSDGLAVGTLWLWLLCLVVGWLRVPIYSSSEISAAIRRSNKKTTKHITKKILRPARYVIDLTRGDQKTDNPKEPEKSGTLSNVKGAGENGEEAQEPRSNPSSSATPLHAPADSQQGNSPPGVGGIQSTRQSSAIGVQPDAEISTDSLTEADKLLIPFTDVGWLHRDESRHPATFNYSRIMRYHILVDDVFKTLGSPDPVDEVGVSEEYPMTEIVSPIFNRNWSLTPRTLPRNVECFLGGRDGRWHTRRF